MDKLNEIKLLKKIEIAVKALSWYKQEFKNAPNPNWHDVASEAIEILEDRKTLEDLKNEQR